MPRNKYVSVAGWSVPAVATLFFTMVLMMACSPAERSWTDDETAALNRWIDANPGGPSLLLSTQLTEGRSAAFIQDQVLRADSIDLMTAMIPSIYDAGVRRLGIFFLESTAQAEIDSFMTSESGVEAEKLLRMADATLGYMEYCDFLTYIQDFNQRISDESERLQVFGLGAGGQTSAEEITMALSVNPESPAPVFLWLKSDDIRLLPAAEYDESGNEAIPVLILAHHFPGNGIIEDTTALRAPRDRSFSFRSGEEPFSEWEGLSPIPEAEIVLVTPFIPYAVTPIEDFVTLADVETARTFFTDPGNENMPASQVRKMNRLISQAARQYSRAL